MESSNLENPHPTAMDSDHQQVGELYGKALINASGDQCDEVIAELRSIVSECLDKHPSLETTLGSPRVKLDAKEGMLDRIFGGRISVTLLNFLKVMCRRDRIQFLRAVAAKASELRDEQTGRLRVIITSAQALSPDQEDQISEKLSAVFGKQIVLFSKTDESLIGGIVVRIGDQVFDGSVLGRMDAMRDGISTGIHQSLKRHQESLITS